MRLIVVLCFGLLVSSCDRYIDNRKGSNIIPQKATTSSATTINKLVVKDYFDLLATRGYKLGKKVEKLYKYVKAVDGYAMEVDGSIMEVYEFDLTTETGKSALDQLKTKGFGDATVIVNKNLALVRHTSHPSYEDLKKLFMTL